MQLRDAVFETKKIRCHSTLKAYIRGTEVVWFGHLKSKVDAAAKIGIGISCSSMTETTSE